MQNPASSHTALNIGSKPKLSLGGDMKIKYAEGPDSVNVGIAGSFKLEEIRDIEDSIAESLLKKESVKFQKVKEPSKKKEE